MIKTDTGGPPMGYNSTTCLIDKYYNDWKSHNIQKKMFIFLIRFWFF